MNRLQLALQGYRTIASSIAVGINEQTSDRAEAWLRDEVCPLFPELARNRSFRLAVRWSGDHLSRGSNTDERGLVEAVDKAFVRCATELAAVTDADAPEPSAAPQDARIPVAIDQADRATIDLLAGRPWLDLACCEDFFHPDCELCLRDPDAARTIAFRDQGELRVPLGDYIARYMFARINYWKSLLDRIWNDVFVPTDSRNCLPHAAANRLFDAKINLDAAINRLRTACCSGSKQQVREGCAVLTQIYAAYAPAPKLEWLGLPTGWAAGPAGLIRHCVRRSGQLLTVRAIRHELLEVVERVPASLCDPDVLRQVAAGLHDVAHFYELTEDSDDLIEWAKDRARLVMVDRSPRVVIWDGKNVADGTWDQFPREWNLLWVLAVNLRRPVDQGMLMNPDQHSIKSRRHRLSQMLDDVLDLDGLIETLRGQGYCLRLPDDDVDLLRDDGTGRLIFEGKRSVAV